MRQNFPFSGNCENGYSHGLVRIRPNHSIDPNSNGVPMGFQWGYTIDTNECILGQNSGR
jgi:hypothetical protein